ncbi:MAG: CHRD domain-containing protein [Solirubrobacteraceae bacterium]|nr:CHRD domain-containing protein [Solirubrobacteraceae bacterium]
MAVAGTAAVAGGGSKQLRASLHGYEEVPVVSSTGSGTFRATVTPSGDGFAYRLSYSGLEGNVTQAHIHLGQPSVNGGISVFFCSNLGNGPAGTQACPPSPATVTGTIAPADVIGPAAQGVAPGEMAELMRAIRAGVTYANVHSSLFPSGEIRGQIRGGGGRDDDDD